MGWVTIGIFSFAETDSHIMPILTTRFLNEFWLCGIFLLLDFIKLRFLWNLFENGRVDLIISVQLFLQPTD